MSGAMTPPGAPPGGRPPGIGGPAASLVMGGAPPPGFPGPQRPPAPPGRGVGGQATGLIKLGQAIKLIQEAMMGLPIGSDIHSAAVKAIRDLSRHVPVGPSTQGVQQTAGADAARNNIQQALLRAIVGQSGPQPMPPSTPLPGA